MRHLSSLAALALCALAGSAVAQPIVFSQWTFNNHATGQIVNNPRPTTGTGVAVSLGMTNNYRFTTSPARTGSITTCDAAASGVSSDPQTSPNNCWRVRGSYDGTLTNAGVGWSIYAPQYTQGAEFQVSTVNYTGVSFTFDWFTTNQGVKHMQVQYSLNGGSTWTNIGAPLVCVTNGWKNSNFVDFSSISGANNNPNFRVRLVSTLDPSPTYTPITGSLAYTGASGGQYNNASGNWRFDMVTFTGTPIGPVSPSITASVNPPAVCSSGGQLTFTASVVSGAAPLSTGLAVRADLSPLGLSSTQSFFDDGTNGDQLAGDGIFTYVATVPGGRPVSNVTINATVSDAQSRSVSTTIPVAIGDCSLASASRVVISQCFGGGGNLGNTPSEDAPYDADFVEIYNRSNQTVSLDGWSVQYTSPGRVTGFDSVEDKVLLSGSIKPGQYMLVRMSDPVPGFIPLPAPDFKQLASFGGMGNTGGRVALVRSTNLIGTNYTSALIEDFVGYGSAAISFEGVAPTGTTANNTAAVRNLSGAQDTNQNFNDFTVTSPTPRNRSVGFLAGYPAVSASAACAGDPVTLTCTVYPASGSTGITVNANVSQFGPGSNVQLFDDGTHGDVRPNDGLYTATWTTPSPAIAGIHSVNFTVTDAQGRSDLSTATMGIANCSSSDAPVVISQVYGGGGNSGSGFNSDYAELFNRSGIPVSLDGWSFQSCRVSDQGFDNRIVLLSGTINPGEYRLVVTNQISPTGAVLPPADFTAGTLFGMESSHGRVVLVSSTNLVGTNFNRFDVVDTVGYGSLAQTYEGIGPVDTLGDILVAVRKNGGCQDTNNNTIDFDVNLALALPHSGASPASICPNVNVCGCAADYNADGGVDGSDIGAFFIDWQSAGGCSDVNQDGGVDGSDIEAFFAVWQAGGC